MAEIKLTETWKASKAKNYPIQLRWTRENTGEAEPRSKRPTTRKEMREGKKTTQAKKSFTRATGKIKNQAPREIKE